MNVCAWCGQTIGTVVGVVGHLSGRPARNFGMCSGCLHARLAALPDPMDEREVTRARRMRECGKSLLHIEQVLEVSQPTVEAALRVA
jgi:hypothetical protein